MGRKTKLTIFPYLFFDTVYKPNMCEKKHHKCYLPSFDEILNKLFVECSINMPVTTYEVLDVEVTPYDFDTNTAEKEKQTSKEKGSQKKELEVTARSKSYRHR